MAYTTYSFSDVSMTISHPSKGQYIMEAGEGVGSITIANTNDNTAHDVAADGGVMVTKIRARNGTVAISMQQTSSLHKWLVNLYNYLEAAATDQWANTGITVRAPKMQKKYTMAGVSPQKPADEPFQAQGQNITWTLMAADIQRDIA